VALFRLLQPVSPVAYSRPGDPPRLMHRTSFDDGVDTQAMRARRVIVKGRFQGGSIGYVYAQDLEQYANAFARPLKTLTPVQRDIFDLLQREGPLSPRQIKEETKVLIKHIAPALERLQEAFLIYEDQVSDDWERSYYDFAGEWPAIQIAEERREEAAYAVLLRFLEGLVFATAEQFKDWSGFAPRLLERLLSLMEQRGESVPANLPGLGQGWLRAQDRTLQAANVPPGVFMLHKADWLVKSHASELKRRFGEHETLQYLLIDGQFAGAVLGHWRIGPHDVDDILVELPAEVRSARREAILQAVQQVYRPPHSHILRCFGQ
jgi:DNA-binding MarR family transcriptional regulator